MSEPLDKPIRMKIFSLPSHLPVVRSAVEKLCEQLGFDPQTVGKIVLGLDEALTNVIRHAYQCDGDKTIDIDLTPLGRPNPGLRIVLRDYGNAADPSKIRSRELGELRPGGLGVHIMNTCMDVVEYKPAGGCGTELTLVKYLPAARKADE